MTATGPAGPDPAPAAESTAQVLAAVFEASPRTLTELAEAAGLTAVEVAPLVGALERHNLLAWDAERTGVRPGTAALRFARSGIGREDLVELAQPSLRRLAEESGETANLILPRPAGTEAIAQVDGRHLLGATNWIGRELALHCTAAGKVFVAFEVAQLPAGELEPLQRRRSPIASDWVASSRRFATRAMRRSSTSSNRAFRRLRHLCATGAGW
jgi:DNA-binding IclR family transcriptional regulator